MLVIMCCVIVCVQQVVRPATKDFPDAAEIKGCVALPCKSAD